MAKTLEELETELESLKALLSDADSKEEREKLKADIKEVKGDLLTWKEKNKPQVENPAGGKPQEVPAPPPPVTNQQLEEKNKPQDKPKKSLWKSLWGN